MPLKRIRLNLLCIQIVALLAMLCCAPSVTADVPSLSLSQVYIPASGETNLEIDIIHNSPTASHSIDLINLTITDQDSGINFYPSVGVPATPQSVTFTVIYELGFVSSNLSVQCKVHCNLDGWSSIASITIYPISAVSEPSVPRNFTATAGDGIVILEWSPPLSNGGLEIVHYNIYRGTNATSITLYEVVDNVTTFSDNDVVNENTYFYRISAVNAAMFESDLTFTINVTPQPIGGGIDLITLAVIVLAIAAIAAVVALVVVRKKPKSP